MLKNVIKFGALFIAFLFVFYFINKMRGKKTVENVQTVELSDLYKDELPIDFAPFYDDFHTDSIFQMSRIIFPISGYIQASDTTKIAEEILWQKEDWKIHTPFNDHNGTFERTFTNLEGIITEKISARDGLFTMEKRYAKLDGIWHLIYYQDLIMHGKM